MSINSGDRPWPQQVAHADSDWPSSDQRVLVPFHEGLNADETGLLAGSITFGADGDLYLLHTVDGDADHAEALHEQARLKRTVTAAFDVPTYDHLTERTRDAVASFVRDHGITTTVVDESEGVLSGRRDRVSAPCHTVVGTGMDTFESPASILVPVASGPHSGLAVQVAGAIARASDCWLELFHVLPEDASESRESDATGLLDCYEYHLDDDVAVDHLVQRGADPAAAIVEHAQYHDLTVLGAPEKGSLRRFLFGSTTDAVTADVDESPVLTVHRNTDESRLSRWV
ncbi:MAG: universal stress protein [Halobacteriaceae archaeon]